MNLKDSVNVEQLSRQGKVDKCLCDAARVSAREITRKIFAQAEEQGAPYEGQTQQQWRKRWLASEEFVLIEVPARQVAVPLLPKNGNKILANLRASATSNAPIVVDLNKQRVGRATTGYVPMVIAVDGKHRHMADLMLGRAWVRAWVGTQALKHLKLEGQGLEISASADISALSPPSTRMEEAMTLYAGMGGTPVPRQDVGDGGSQPTMRMPAVKSTGRPMKPYTKAQKPEVQAGHGKDCDCEACADKRKMEARCKMEGTGTSEGAQKGWETRPRSGGELHKEAAQKRAAKEAAEIRRSFNLKMPLSQKQREVKPPPGWFGEPGLEGQAGGTGGPGGSTSGLNPMRRGFEGTGTSEGAIKGWEGRRKELESLHRQAADSAHQSTGAEKDRWQQKADKYHQQLIKHHEDAPFETKHSLEKRARDVSKDVAKGTWPLKFGADDPSDTESVIDPSDTGYPPDPSDRKMSRYGQAQTSTAKCETNDTLSDGMEKESLPFIRLPHSPRKQSPGSGGGARYPSTPGASGSDLARSGKMGKDKELGGAGFSDLAKVMNGAGTSEGATKGWEGRHANHGQKVSFGEDKKAAVGHANERRAFGETVKVYQETQTLPRAAVDLRGPRGAGDVRQSKNYFVKPSSSMNAVGTSEGATKGWEHRQREAGKTAKAYGYKPSGGNPRATSTRYESKHGHVVWHNATTDKWDHTEEGGHKTGSGTGSTSLNDHLAQLKQQHGGYFEAKGTKIPEMWQKKKKLQSAAPGGWEGTVKHMKEHGDIDNPWALAHHMKKEGAKAHYTEKGKLKKQYKGKQAMEAVAPPGFSEKDMHQMKRKYGEESAFKVAWSIHKDKTGKRREMESALMLPMGPKGPKGPTGGARVAGLKPGLPTVTTHMPGATREAPHVSVRKHGERQMKSFGMGGAPPMPTTSMAMPRGGSASMPSPRLEAKRKRK